MYLIYTIDIGYKNIGFSIFNLFNLKFDKLYNIKRNSFKLFLKKIILKNLNNIKIFIISFIKYKKIFFLNYYINLIFILKKYIKIIINKSYFIKVKIFNEINSSKFFFLRKKIHKYSSCYIFKKYAQKL